MGRWSPLSASFIRTTKEIVIVQATTNLRLRWQTFACKYYGLQSTQCWSANKLTKAIELNVFLSILSDSQPEKIELCKRFNASFILRAGGLELTVNAESHVVAKKVIFYKKYIA